MVDGLTDVTDVMTTGDVDINS